jgi:hypothetical protein
MLLKTLVAYAGLRGSDALVFVQCEQRRERIRVAEVAAVLSLATDLGMAPHGGRR